jgi:hypothetical protein
MVTAVSSSGHIEVTMVPMPVSDTDANSDWTDSDFDVFRDDRRFVAGVQSTGKCRHGQERNNKKGKQSILHDTFFWLARSLARSSECAFVVPVVCIELTSALSGTIPR